MHRIEVPQWAVESARNHFDAIDPARTALLVVDMQNGFLTGPIIENQHALDIIPGINAVAAALRAAGGTIVAIRHTISNEPRFRLTEWQDRMSPRDPAGGYLLEVDKPAHLVHPELEIHEDDLEVLKYRFSAFLPNSSDLDDVLRARGIDTLIISGTVTNVCCESTARDGYMMGYRILFLSDGTAALSDEEHNATLLSMTRVFATVLSVNEMIRMITAASATVA